ncbi:hypothetical protein [Rathayibacter sp. VKM Ac-2754]|uniref:hypothetical protein n=1 Tax=Rathayibacter sp. VKM Ac-2754 TaxID=2609251 RepID=UPI00135B3EAF|nr:hypothetical protein [Rathayibacter sp. VKM Ac-2754]MWV60304.1 hypothetical protein [Rathayibacter sp. VKM Ac-2754]
MTGGLGGRADTGFAIQETAGRTPPVSLTFVETCTVDITVVWGGTTTVRLPERRRRRRGELEPRRWSGRAGERHPDVGSDVRPDVGAEPGSVIALDADAGPPGRAAVMSRSSVFRA